MIKEGSLLHTNLLQLIGEIFRERFTGAMRLETGHEVRIVYFKDGHIISCGTNVNAEKIDEVLLSLGKITHDHIREILESSQTFSEMGKKLLSLGFLSQAELEEALRHQVSLIFQNLLRNPESAFSLVENYAPTRTDVFLYPTDHFISNFLHATDDRELIFSLMPSPQARAKGKPLLAAHLESLPWDQEEKAVAGRLDGTASLAELAGQTRMREMEVYKLFAVLSCLDLLDLRADHEAVVQETPSLPPLTEELIKPAPVQSFPLPRQSAIPTFPPYKLRTNSRHLAGRKDKTKRLFVLYPLIGLGAAILIFAGALSYHHYTQPPSGPSPAQPPTRSTPDKPAKPIVLTPSSGLKTPQTGTTPSTTPDQGTGQLQAPLTTSSSPAAEKKPEPATPVAPTLKPPITQAVKPEAKPGLPPEALEPAKIPTPPSAAKPVAPAQDSKPKPTVAPFLSGGYVSEAAAMASKMKGLPGATLTLQLMIACQDDSITKARKLDPGGALWFIPYPFKGKPCYKVYWGTFPGAGEAQAASEALPAEFKSGKPQVVTLGAALSNASH
jgi:septal ring-binding cell division protein DamX